MHTDWVRYTLYLKLNNVYRKYTYPVYVISNRRSADNKHDKKECAKKVYADTCVDRFGDKQFFASGVRDFCFSNVLFAYHHCFSLLSDAFRCRSRFVAFCGYCAVNLKIINDIFSNYVFCVLDFLSGLRNWLIVLV